MLCGTGWTKLVVEAGRRQKHAWFPTIQSSEMCESQKKKKNYLEL